MEKTIALSYLESNRITYILYLAVDGFRRCEKWMRNDATDSKESKTTSWFKRFIGREQKPEVTWPFPFVEGRLFILTIRAGIEGYHISVGGRHVTSFPYRTVIILHMIRMFESFRHFSALH